MKIVRIKKRKGKKVNRMDKIRGMYESVKATEEKWRGINILKN